LWDGLLGGPAMCLEYVWFRAKGPGQSRATPPHCDAPYMARGTHDLYVAWVPYVDIGLSMGGLMLLEGSHRNPRVRAYCRHDVDVYCQNWEDAPLIESGQKTFQRNGAWSLDAISARAELGGRWLTAEYRMGDVLIFGIFTMHATCDNQTDRIRISSDTRYQRASDPVDDRWAGTHPIGHGPAAKHGVIC
jgi:ectoine hydroxylase-related dioxygenase (phytanoyl-CoA dioxygenase family)